MQAFKLQTDYYGGNWVWSPQKYKFRSLHETLFSQYW